jgi:outer membrane protein assembly factor BamB
VAFGGYVTVPDATGGTGYLVGGEVAVQSGPDAAGIASGTLQTVLTLRLSAWGGPSGSPGSGAPYAGTFLIADRGNDRLISLDTARTVTWSYPSATMPAPPGGFYFPDDAFFIHHGTGIISNQEDNHTIVEIGYPSGRILWQYGHPGIPGSQPGYLDQPDDAYLLRSGTITVADASNNRILFLSPQGTVLGQIGNGADAHVPQVSIAYPNGDTPLDDGNVLVSEITGSWVDEYTPSGHLVWSVHMTSVDYPSDPQQLGADLYLMTDYDPPAEGRILEFTRAGTVTWRYDALAGDGALKKPSLAERMPNGLIMVNDDYRDRVVAIDPTTDEIVWQYGLTDDPGTAPGLVSIPDGFDNLLADGVTPTHPQTG